jgi:cysteine desulfurase
VARHYLDHASTSPPRPEALAALTTWAEGPFADPGRVHQEGREVRHAVEAAREQVAGLLGVRPRQVIFTSGATEAVNAAVFGAVRARPGARVLCAAVEHSAVRDASSRWAPLTTLPVDRVGRIAPDAVAEALAGPGEVPALVHCQWANHEVATVQPVATVAELCRAAGVPLHVDAAAACGQVDLGLDDLDVDLVSVSAHKLGGLPGTGALVVRRNRRIEPLLVGGLQERARRAGMENIPGIVAFGAVAAALADEGGRRRRDEEARARRRTVALAEAAAGVPGVTLVGDPDPTGRLPHLVCLGVAGVEAEPVLIGLDRAGVAAHSGSACASESLEPSPVLEAMGADASHSLRLSVGWSTTDDDVDAFAGAFAAVVAGLRGLRA